MSYCYVARNICYCRSFHFFNDEMEYLLFCFIIAGSLGILISDELLLCSKENLLLYCLVFVGGFCFVSEELPLNGEEYLLLDYFLFMYHFMCGGGIRFVSLDIHLTPLCYITCTS